MISKNVDNEEYRIRFVDGEVWALEDEGEVIHKDLASAMQEIEEFLNDAAEDGLEYDEDDIEIIDSAGVSISLSFVRDFA